LRAREGVMATLEKRGGRLAAGQAPRGFPTWTDAGRHYIFRGAVDC